MTDLASSPSDRRGFLRLGGTAVVGAAVLAACGSQESSPPAETGDKPLSSETTLAPPQTTSPEQGAATDAAVVRTGRSLELAAAEIYTILLGEATASTDPDALLLPNDITLDPEVRDAFTLLRTRHEEHAQAMVPFIIATEGAAVTEPNSAVLEGLLGASIDTLTSQARVVAFAHEIETLITSTLAWGAGVVTTADLRSDIMSIGAVSAQQASLVSLLLDPTGGRAVPAAVIDTSGPARIPEFMILQEAADGGDVPATAAEAAEAEAPAEGEDAEGAEGEDAEGG